MPLTPVDVRSKAQLPVERSICSKAVIDRTIKETFRYFGDSTPTADFYGAISDLFSIVNKALWQDRLPDKVLFTVNTPGSRASHYQGARWQRVDGNTADEISFNAAFLQQDNGLDFLMALVHECCHLWQFHFGNPSKRRYHNTQLASEMRRVGLEPTNIGSGGGLSTGFRIRVRVIDGGGVDLLYRCLLQAGFEITWRQTLRQSASININAEELRQKKRASKTRYSCAECGLNAWARPNAHLLCGACGVTLEP